jgi:hypothetical protein
LPTIETVHVIALVTVLGMIAIVDLRLIGVGSRQLAVTKLSNDTLPWVWGAFALAAITVALLFVSKASSYVANPYFLWKMVMLALAGMNMMYFINEIGGGMRGGKKMKGLIPGGSSCPLLRADECDIPMDYDSMAKAGTMLGSGGMMVMDEDTDMVKVALRIMRFYKHESCGWCIPCREGTTWLQKMLARIVDGNGAMRDVDLIGDLAKNMLGRTFCPLGDAAAMPTISIVEKFRPEFEAYVAKNPFAASELVQVA